MKKRDIFFTVIFLLIALYFFRIFYLDLTQTLDVLDQEPVGTVIVKKNLVQRRFADRVLWDRLRVESPVYIGNIIRVPDASAAALHIEGVLLDLDENTLIRITLSEDGEIQINLDSGNVTLVANENSGSILLNHNGNVVKTEPGLIITASFDHEEIISIPITDENFFIPIADSSIQLINPVTGSVFRYFENENNSKINFHWSEIEESIFYILEISDTYDFSGSIIRSETSATISFAELEEGVWYWRVKPVFPAIFNDTNEYSEIFGFRVEKSAISLDEFNELDILDWITMETPYENLSALINADEDIEEVPVLPAPRNLRPIDGHYFGTEQLRAVRNIVFSWQAVNDANGYIVTIYKETEDGIILIARSNLITQASWLLRDLSVLNNGVFTWQVEAMERDSDGLVLRRAVSEESHFIINVPAPGVELHEMRNLYEN